MRILHTMLRVGNLPRSLDFYTRVLGMRLLRSTERPEQAYSLAFVGYGDESDTAVLELTYNHGVDGYDLGTAVAVGVTLITGLGSDLHADKNDSGSKDVGSGVGGVGDHGGAVAQNAGNVLEDGEEQVAGYTDNGPELAALKVLIQKSLLLFCGKSVLILNHVLAHGEDLL